MPTTPRPEAPSVPREASGDGARSAALWAAAIGGALTIGALALFGGRTALSVGLGSVIAVANLVTMNAIVRAMLRPAEPVADAEAHGQGDAVDDAFDPEGPTPDHVARGKRGGIAWAVFAVLKIVVLFGGIWLLLTRGLVDPMPLVVGYGVLPLGITLSGLFKSLAPRPRGRRSRTE